MKVITANNVNDALLKGIDLFKGHNNYRVQESRNGTTYEALSPVTTVYRKPWERVCLIPERDANPFFHYIEGLWMLNGQNDLKTVKYYVKTMENFSDDGEILWGAYGWRWRSYFKQDQLHDLINILKREPDNRRAVLQMWDVKEDLGRRGKDVPCNTHVYFKIRDDALDMTVCCRSNDMVWGVYGANAVHMSMLQEYIASMIGVNIGVYRQISDSFHVYQNDLWESLKHLTIDPFYANGRGNLYYTEDLYYPLITNTETFDEELKDFMDFPHRNITISNGWDNFAFKSIAHPMVCAYWAHKKKDYDKALAEAQYIVPLDWKKACTDWLLKRKENFENKGERND